MSTDRAVHGNARLRAALVASGLTIEAVAREVGTDPRTVERWLNEPGRTPYARHAHAVARMLHADPYRLWPTLGTRHKATPAPRDELLTWYPTRAAVPAALWPQVPRGAGDRIDLALSCGLFLLDAVPDLVGLLTDRAAAGVRVRIALPDPTLAPTQSEATRLLLVEDLFADLYAAPGVRMARHGGIANDVVRADDQMLVMPRVDGCPPAAAPVLHLTRLEHAPLTSAYLLGLDHVFTTALPTVRTRPLAAA
ncbi:hypothetical protein BX265_3833 [Streptomyces sp. TLI_235]|nr:helix-turn-helix transcriptional regulator [Streptomyces sp. TLI_235]PBC79040.1 hypothetical protein BX265_3833 [Streptomyces sp. TLI_235]